MVMIKDNIEIGKSTVLPANTIWAGGTVASRRPGRFGGELNECWAADESNGFYGRWRCRRQEQEEVGCCWQQR